VKDWRIQRPSTVWIETTVQADSLEDALELADKDFTAGDYTEAADTWADSFDIDYSRYWAEDETGEEYSQYEEGAADA
jgi:hypothetical protein